MDDLISRKAAIDAMNTWDWQELYLPIHFKQLLDEVPSAQRKGHWININEGKWNTCAVFKCSECGEIDNRIYETDNFCPNCGADMRQKEYGYE